MEYLTIVSRIVFVSQIRFDWFVECNVFLSFLKPNKRKPRKPKLTTN